MDDNKFASFADIRIINGELRSGKTGTGVGFAIDDHYKKLTGIVSPNGEILKARSLNNGEGLMLKKAGVKDWRSYRLKYVRIYASDENQSKIIRIPKGWFVVSPVKIFSNLHLYGVKYAYISLADIIEYMNTDLFDDSWILSDESVMNDPRNSMERAGKLSASFGTSVGKRNIRMCFMIPFNEMLERRYRLFHTMRVLCTFDPQTRYITLDITKRGEPEFSTDYYAPIYWPFFNSREVIPVPQYKIDRTLAQMIPQSVR